MRDIFDGTKSTEERERIAHDAYTKRGDRQPLDAVKYERAAKEKAALEGVELPAYSRIDHDAQRIFFGDVIYGWKRLDEGSFKLERIK